MGNNLRGKGRQAAKPKIDAVKPKTSALKNLPIPKGAGAVTAPEGTMPSFGMEDIVNLMSQNRDAREKAFSEMVGKLFDKKSLLMISRLNADVSMFIVKHLIARRYFMYYWQEHKAHGVWTMTDTPPYYKVKWKHDRGFSQQMMKDSYNEFLDELMQVTISFQGKGREEILATIKSAESKILEQEMMQNRTGLLGRFLS